MFTLLTGSFHSALEPYLVETVRQYKLADPFVPLSVIVPSAVMRRRVQWVLCAEHGLPLFHVSFFTFHQLALRLHAEQTLLDVSPETGLSSIQIVEDHWYEWMVSWLRSKLDMDSQDDQALSRSRGMRQALWRTIRDLHEGQVDPAVGMRAVDEGLFDASTCDRLRRVFSLQAAVLKWSRHFKVGLPDDVTQAILPWVPRSPFLREQANLLYYGFYDLTQIQLSLLEEVARARPVKVFFPLEKGPGYHYARRFLERYLLKGGVDHCLLETDRRGTASGVFRPGPPVRQVVSVVGEGGELRFACETILGLVERDGYAFHEIGVVARTLEPYCPFLPRMFREHRIPFSTTGTRPFLEEPWAKVWWQLAGLHRDNFPVQAMMDILTSPFFRCTNAFSRSLLEDAHWWWRLVRHARVIRGRADWDRLAELAEDPSYVQELLENQVLPPHLAREDVCAFARECMRLIQSFDSCPLSGTVGEITAYFEGLFEACVVLPGRSASLDEHAEGMPDASELTECAGHVMSLLGQWDRLGERISSDLWVERFRELLEEAELPLPGQSQVGVQVMDVMAARGYGFRALLILGLNDQVFPRVVREDALLRDRERRVLAESLGYKVDEKLQGLDEEALLFTLLERSAKDRLFLIHQRADSQGRPLIPSSFLSPDCLKAGEDNASVVHVPLSVLERHRLCDDSLAMTTSQNSLIFAMLQGGGLSVEAPDLGSWGVILSHGRQAMEVLERSALPAGSFDGLVEADHLPWRKMQARGISPTGLERYVQCPLRFWMQDLLGAQDVRQPVTRDLPARVWGQLGHEVLHGIYESLAKEGWPRVDFEPCRMHEFVHALIRTKAHFYARAYGKGYVMLWQDLMRRLEHVIEDMVARDQEDFVRQGWVPLLFEVEGTGSIPSSSGESEEGVAIHGRVDRVDQGRAGQGVRVVDYKFSWSRARNISEPDVLLEAGQGKRLQAPFYAWLSAFQGGESMVVVPDHPKLVDMVEFRFIRPFQTPSLGFASLLTGTWTGEIETQLSRRILDWLRAIQQGNFFLITGAHCRDCAWSGACRSQHHPSWSRVQGLPLARQFRLLKKERMFHG